MVGPGHESAAATSERGASAMPATSPVPWYPRARATHQGRRSSSGTRDSRAAIAQDCGDNRNIKGISLYRDLGLNRGNSDDRLATSTLVEQRLRYYKLSAAASFPRRNHCIRGRNNQNKCFGIRFKINNKLANQTITNKIKLDYSEQWFPWHPQPLPATIHSRISVCICRI